MAAAPAVDDLVERERELASLSEAFDRVTESSTGRLVIVSGEAGIGKTALIRRHCEERRRVARILWGACESLLTPSPLAPLVDVAESCGGPLEQLLSCETTAHELTLALVRELRREAPTILVLEDVHWADDATLDVLRLLGRRHAGVPALVLVSYRDSALALFHPLRSLLGELGSGSSVERLRLETLSLAAVRGLAAPHRADADELYRKTGGNPFFVTEAVAAGDEVPPTVRDAVLARVARLSPRAWALLETVAAARSPAELWLLEAIDPNVLAGAPECLAAGMLTADGNTLSFRHELARLAAEEAIAPGRLLALHRAALHALATGPPTASGLARLAHHAEAAGDAAAVVRYAPAAAARAAAVGAHREAAAQYARAARFPAACGPERFAELCTSWSVECFLTARDEEAEAAIEQAIATYRQAGDRLREGNGLLWLALVLRNLGRTAEAVSAAERALALLEQLPPGHDLATAYSALAGVVLLDEDAGQTRAWATKAIELAERLDDASVSRTAHGTLAAADALCGSTRARHELERLLSVATRTGSGSDVGRCYLLLGMAACRERSIERMRSYVEPGLAFCEEHDLAVWGRYLLAMRCWVELEEGAWDRAAETAATVLAHGCTLASLQAQIVLGLLRARRGDPDPWTPLAEADRIAQASGQLWWTAQVAAARAEAAWLGGRFELVTPATDDAFRLACSLGSPWPAGELACWRRRAGNTGDAPAVAAEPFALELAGDWAGAAELWSESGCSYESALALADADADEPLLDALAELQRLDARPGAALVARRLRERGARRLPRGPRPTTRANAAHLTRREVDVLALLAAGLQNREIAARLYLSHRTVEHHVASILRKLDTHSRAQAVREGARLGLLDRPAG